MEARILIGDARKRLAELPAGSVRTCITSPPYFGLRDYGESDQMGLEETPEAYVEEMVLLFREVWRVLSDDGTLWLNLGDSYNGSGGNHKPEHKNDTGFQGKIGADKYKGKGNMVNGLKPKDLIGIPWRVALALQADGWYLRQDIIWAKPNPMPESVTDRCTKSHEYVFLLSKSARYYYDHEAVKEPSIHSSDRRAGEGRLTYKGKRQGNQGTGQEAFVSITETRNKRDVWTIASKPFKGAHFAVMPEALVEPCVLAGSAEGDTVLDPFTGSGTVAVVALQHGRNFVGTELNPEYGQIAKDRITKASPMFNEVVIDDEMV